MPRCLRHGQPLGLYLHACMPFHMLSAVQRSDWVHDR